MSTVQTRRVCAGVLGSAFLLCGCGAPGQIDPWEKTNRAVYDFDVGLDKYALKPLADGYVLIVPKPVRTGLGNAFDNLGYGDVILNDFLQGKWEQGWSDSGRMAVNSTIGLAGIFDVATLWKMPAHQNDFGITLGKWGMESGPYMVLPLFGPSCVRDVPGAGVTIAMNPLTWADVPWYVTVPINVLEVMDGRARAELGVRFRDQAAIDPYVFTRDAYLKYREGRIHENQPSVEPGFYDEEAPATAPATRPAAVEPTEKGS